MSILFKDFRAKNKVIVGGHQHSTVRYRTVPVAEKARRRVFRISLIKI